MHGGVSEGRARNRWLLIQLARTTCVVVAVFGVVLLGKATEPVGQALGMAIALMAMWMMLIVPKMLAHRWRTPPPDQTES